VVCSSRSGSSICCSIFIVLRKTLIREPSQDHAGYHQFHASECGRAGNRARQRMGPAPAAWRAGRRPSRPAWCGTPGSGKEGFSWLFYARPHHVRIQRMPIPPCVGAHRSQRPRLISSIGQFQALRRHLGQTPDCRPPIGAVCAKLLNRSQWRVVFFHHPSRRFMPEKGCAPMPELKRPPTSW